jgi:hypothetical protein
MKVEKQGMMSIIERKRIDISTCEEEKKFETRNMRVRGSWPSAPEIFTYEEQKNLKTDVPLKV